MAVVAEKRRRKSHRQDGYRTIVDWTAARADVSHETARALCWTATRLGDAHEVAEKLAAGEISFDRAQLLARLPAEHRSDHEGFDISQLRRLVADHKRLTRKRERKTGNGYLHFGHSDELATTYWGELPGLDARIMEKAVDQRADEIIPADQRLAVAERRALALVSILQDSLYQDGSSERITTCRCGGDRRRTHAAETNGETRRPQSWLDREWDREPSKRSCAMGIVELFGLTENGKPLDPWDDAQGPWAGSCDVMSSDVTVDALWTAALSLPARSTPRAPLGPRRKNRCGQSDHPLLVSPSCIRTPRRTPDHPSRSLSGQTETTPIGAPFPRPDNSYS